MYLILNSQEIQVSSPDILWQ